MNHIEMNIFTDELVVGEVYSVCQLRLKEGSLVTGASNFLMLKFASIRSNPAK